MTAKGSAPAWRVPGEDRQMADTGVVKPSAYGLHATEHCRSGTSHRNSPSAQAKRLTAMCRRRQWPEDLLHRQANRQQPAVAACWTVELDCYR